MNILLDPTGIETILLKNKHVMNINKYLNGMLLLWNTSFIEQLVGSGTF